MKNQTIARTSTFIVKWWPVLLMGTASMGAYGLVLYAFGVFIGPIKEETGWSYGTISAAFSMGVLISGIGATLTGRLLDAVGSRPVLLGALILGSVLLHASSFTQSQFVFVMCWGLGGGVIGAGLFYNITMAVATRLYRYDDRAKGFAILTFIGGLASPIFFPLAGLMVEHWGWRSALRGLIVVLILCVLPAVVMIRGGNAEEKASDNKEKQSFVDILNAFKSRQVYMMVLAFSLCMAIFAAIQVHHVPAMTATGLSLTLATTLAGIRGFLSLPGRAMLSPIVKLTGTRGATQVMYAAMILSAAALYFAGPIGFVVGFIVISGLTFGLIVPLHGLYAAEVFSEQHIGTLMGVQTTIVGVATALGPMLLGLTVDPSGGYETLLLISVAVTALAMVTLAASKSSALPQE